MKILNKVVKMNNLIWPFGKVKNITSKFDELRPWDNPNHYHGAIDVGARIGTDIFSPEDGELIKYFSIRDKGGQFWGNDKNVFPFRNYFYDMYGGLLVLVGKSGITHVFCHLYMNNLYNTTIDKWDYKESKKDERFPRLAFTSERREVVKGQYIGEVGNAGFSTGSHCHYEMHHGFKWEVHEDRIDPEAFYKKVGLLK